MEKNITEEYYQLPLSGEQIKERLLNPSTDDLEGGVETWLLKCGDADSNID